MAKKFKYKGYIVTIKTYADSWDKKITIKKGKKKKTYMYNLKHMTDAIDTAKNIIKHEEAIK